MTKSSMVKNIRNAPGIEILNRPVKEGVPRVVFEPLKEVRV